MNGFQLGKLSKSVNQRHTSCAGAAIAASSRTYRVKSFRRPLASGAGSSLIFTLLCRFMGMPSGLRSSLRARRPRFFDAVLRWVVALLPHLAQASLARHARGVTELAARLGVVDGDF